jgi:hypothetical protein
MNKLLQLQKSNNLFIIYINIYNINDLFNKNNTYCISLLIYYKIFY